MIILLQVLRDGGSQESGSGGEQGGRGGHKYIKMYLKYKYKILCGKEYLKTNTVTQLQLKIHKIHLKLAIQ